MKDQGFVLDGIVTVIDCVNFRGYEDTSYTAKMQAKYTDITLLNKHELVKKLFPLNLKDASSTGSFFLLVVKKVTECQIDDVLDHVYGLNPDVPVIRCNGQLGVDPGLVFGLDSKLFLTRGQVSEADQGREGHLDHHAREVDLIQVLTERPLVLERDEVERFLGLLKAENFYRIKGILVINGEAHLANFAFGRPGWTKLTKYDSSKTLQLVFMGMELGGHRKKIQEFFGLLNEELSFHAAHSHSHSGHD